MTNRIYAHLLGGFAALAALCALPAIAEDAPVAGKSAASASEPLSKALVALSTSNGFELRGLDKVGDETVKPPKAGTPVQALRHLLDGYAYTLELAPADGAAKTSGKLLRVSILGHAGAVTADAAQNSAAATPAAQPAIADADAQPGATTHPVTHMLETIARSSITRAPTVGTAASSVQLTGAPAASGLAAPAPASSDSPSSTSAVTGDGSSNTTDMAALTRVASANLSALVQSLKAACPAGGKC